MRPILILLATTALVGCTVKNTTIRQSDAPPAAVVAPPPTVMYQVPTPSTVYESAQAYATPTISYTVTGQAQFDQAAIAASNWCHGNYSSSSQLIDRRPASVGEIVTFGCGTAMPPYRAPQAATTIAPPPGSFGVTYTGPNGYQMAWTKANNYCVAHYGNSRVSLLANDEAAGRATFACQRL